jgi:hypothetical protein
MSVLEDWTAEVSRTLGVDQLSAHEQRVVLDVARDVAHNVARPAAPISAFLLGVAVGRGETLSTAANVLVELSARFVSPEGPQEAT